MEMLDYTFELGVVYIVFSILWFVFAAIPRFFLVDSYNPKSLSAHLFKAIQYYCLAGLTAVHTKTFIETNNILSSQFRFYIVLGGIILSLYVAGKAMKTVMSVKIVTNGSKLQMGAGLYYEPHIAGIAVVLYSLSYIYPGFIDNTFINKTYAGIFDFYHTFFIHFVISIAAFIFLVSMLFKGVRAIGYLTNMLFSVFSGKENYQQNNGTHYHKEQFGYKNEDSWSDDEYVDFEEINEEE